MKLPPLTNILVAGILALGTTASINQPSQAQDRQEFQGRQESQRRQGFYCDTSGNKPMTIYRNREGDTETWVRWTSNYFKNAGYDPLTRCQDVSERLETFRRHKQLRFVTTGRMNGQNVICTSSESEGRCDGLILTLKPRENPQRALANLFAWRRSGSASYGRGIDVRERLGTRKE